MSATPGISPEPSDEEAAAILAALTTLDGAAGAAGDDRGDVPRWRWSGRWWSKPVTLRRERRW